MIVYGRNLFQDKEPTPSNPQPIKFDNFYEVKINGKTVKIACDNKKIKRIFQENGRWYIEYEEYKSIWWF
mgnify:CR=1 FL=1